MDEKRIRDILAIYSDKLPVVSLEALAKRVAITQRDENSLQIHLSLMKDPTISLILSILAGTLGVDRFYMGDIGLGICKLITGGGCGIWWLIDIFLVMNETKSKNLQMLYMWL